MERTLGELLIAANKIVPELYVCSGDRGCDHCTRNTEVIDVDGRTVHTGCDALESDAAKIIEDFIKYFNTLEGNKVNECR